MLIAVSVILGALLILGAAGYAGIRRDRWYQDKINRSRYPFESEVLSDRESEEMDRLIREFEKKAVRKK